MESTIPRPIALLLSSFHQVRGPEKAFFPYLEEDLCPGIVKRSRGKTREGWLSSFHSPRWSRGLSSGLFSAGPLLVLALPCYQCFGGDVLVCLLEHLGHCRGWPLHQQPEKSGRCSPIRKACITNEGCALGIPWVLVVKRATNWARGSSSFWLSLRSDVVVGLGCALSESAESDERVSSSGKLGMGVLERGAQRSVLLRGRGPPWKGKEVMLRCRRSLSWGDRLLRQLQDVGDDGLDHPGQGLDLMGEFEKGFGGDGRWSSAESGRRKPRVVKQPPIATQGEHRGAPFPWRGEMRFAS
ncbi:hypothetical protein BHM03_00041894 [Ensete ventricosum]|nr:hypothetical protein BHM03_00041894 [Ensete ventricosum]